MSLPAPTALELARIVQEALVNVRKHSRARNVLVRLTNTDQRCTLVIEDDGQGFEFEGRLSAGGMEKRPRRPRNYQGAPRASQARSLAVATPRRASARASR